MDPLMVLKLILSRVMFCYFVYLHGRMAGDGEGGMAGGSKVSLGPTMPHPSTESISCHTAVLGVACSQRRWPVVVFNPFGHPKPYAYVYL
jgi:hypothetical protein